MYTSKIPFEWVHFAKLMPPMYAAEGLREPEQVPKIVRSMKRYGWKERPLLGMYIDPENGGLQDFDGIVLLTGSHRYEALRDMLGTGAWPENLKYGEVPVYVIRRDDVTEDVWDRWTHSDFDELKQLVEEKVGPRPALQLMAVEENVGRMVNPLSRRTEARGNPKSDLATIKDHEVHRVHIAYKKALKGLRKSDRDILDSTYATSIRVHLDHGFTERESILRTLKSLTKTALELKRGNPVEFAVPLVQGIATGTGFGIAAGITAPFAVKAGRRILRGAKGRKNPVTREITESNKALKRALKGLSATELEGLVRLHDLMYDAYRLEGFNDAHAAIGSNNIVIDKVREIKSSRKRRGNPSNAQQLSEEFHGRPSTDIQEFEQSEEYHDELAGLGDLTELEVVASNGRFKTPLDFSGDGVSLASTPDGKQLHFIGGEQSLDDNFLKAMGLSKAEIDKDSVKLGMVHTISYFADKHHLTGSRSQKDGTEYIHEFGEAGGSKPMLVYDKLNERLELVGGTYVVRGEGVVN